MTFDGASSAPADATVATQAFTGHWRVTEIAVLREHYPSKGRDGVHLLLPHRTVASIGAKARMLGIKCKRASTLGLRFPRLYPQRDDIDAMIREAYSTAARKGDIAAAAARIGRPAWWVHKRACDLGCARSSRTRIDAWTKPELALLEEWASCDSRVIAKKLRAAGFKRTPIAVSVKLKRLEIDRHDPDRWNATQVAPLLGVDPATVHDWIARRGLKATQNKANGVQTIERKHLRAWVATHQQFINLRRVDQPWFMELAFGRAAA